MLFSSPAFAAGNGDLTNDGLLTESDLNMLNAHLLGQITLTAPQATAADMNGDSKVDIADTVIIRNFLNRRGVFVNVTPDTGSWQYTGPGGIAVSRVGDTAAGESNPCPPGVYRLHALPLSGYTAPADVTANATSGTLIFTPTYLPVGVHPETPTLMVYSASVNPFNRTVSPPGGTISTAAGISGFGSGAVEYHWITRRPDGKTADSGPLSVSLVNGSAAIPAYDGFPTDAVGDHKAFLRVTSPAPVRESPPAGYAVAKNVFGIYSVSMEPFTSLPSGKISSSGTVHGIESGAVEYMWIIHRPAGPEIDSGKFTVSMVDGKAVVPAYDGFPRDRPGAYSAFIRVTKPEPMKDSPTRTYSVAPRHEMIDVAAGKFMMGCNQGGDLYWHNEQPIHEVTLDAYQIGKYEVTNGEVCDVLNWAKAKGYLKNKDGSPYSGGDVYANNQLIIPFNEWQVIVYASGIFSPMIRPGAGGVMYSMQKHPITRTTWIGCAMLCNWMSEMEGLTPCYDPSNWLLVKPYPNGYHLPTEAEWERAAAWDGTKHWIYYMMSDTFPGSARCNWVDRYVEANPLGLSSAPHTTPVGWFNGINVSPNGNIQTIDSPSPVGCYDMSGNAWEWVQDWYHPTYDGAPTDGSAWEVKKPTYNYRVIRGGCFYSDYIQCHRSCYYEDSWFSGGFRLARKP